MSATGSSAEAGELADLSPAYFELVMATGIVSLAGFMMGYEPLAFALFDLNMLQYAVLVVLYAVRAARYPRCFFGDMVGHLSGRGYFTAVAGTAILASQFLVLGGSLEIGLGLWTVAIVLWVGLTYTIFTAFTVKAEKPTLDRGINGGWLLAVVATQALSFGFLGGVPRAFFFIAVVAWVITFFGMLRSIVRGVTGRSTA